MDMVNYSDARQNLKALMGRMVSDVTEIVVTRQSALGECWDPDAAVREIGAELNEFRRSPLL